MCTTPNTLRDGKIVACHSCQQCREQAIDDWVGRNIAEQKTSDASFFVTLTYGRNQAGDSLHERSVVLTYRDPQLYFKMLRWHGFNVRYMVAGEYGTKKGRAHWHAIVHFKGAVPIHTITPPNHKGVRFDHYANKPDGSEIWGTGVNKGVRSMWWPWGHSVWKKATPENIRYCCEYVLKDNFDDAAQSKFCMSKQPPIGSEWAAREAQRYVDQYVAVQTLDYKFPDVRYKSGKNKGRPRNYRWRGKAAEIFLEEYVRRWHERHGAVPMPYSQVVQDYLLRWGDPEFASRIKRMRARIEMEKRDNLKMISSQKPVRGWIDPPVQHDKEELDDDEPQAKPAAWRARAIKRGPQNMSEFEYNWRLQNGLSGPGSVEQQKQVLGASDEGQGPVGTEIADEVARWHLARLNEQTIAEFERLVRLKGRNVPF